MKNFAPLMLLIITILLIGLMVGILVGRHIGQSAVKLSEYDRHVADSTPATNNTAGKIDINLASVAELDMLPGIGEMTAKSIVEYRNTHGLFATIYDLENVTGIGKKRIESIAQYITVGGQS
jgi:competence ComEA-like helix-hairpin-helix protein